VKQGAKLDPDLFIAHKNIAVIKNQTGFKSEAVKEWDIALKISPGLLPGIQ